MLARVAAIGGATATEGRSIPHRHVAGFALGVARMTWLTSAVAFTLVEDAGQGGRLHIEWIDWYNAVHLHGEIGDTPPAEREADWYRHDRAAPAALTT